MARTAFFAQASATATRATVAFTTAVNFSNTPPANSSVLYIGAVELLASTAGFYEYRMRDNTNASSYSVGISRLTQLTSAECLIGNSWSIISYGAAPPSQSISFDVRSSVATNVLQYSNAYLMGLVLSPNDQFVIGSDTFTSGISGSAFTTIGSQLNVSVATSGSWLVLTYAETSVPTQGDANTAPSTSFRTIVDGSNRKTKFVDRIGAGSRGFVDMFTESWTAGAHRVNLAATHSGVSGRAWSRRVRHVALELSAFAFSYIDGTVAGVSGSATSFATVKSFTPNIQETKNHLMLAYINPMVLATGADALTRYTRFLKNTENVCEVNVGSSTQASVAGGFAFPFIIPIVATVTSGTENNFSILQKVELLLTAAGVHNHLDSYTFAILQLAGASVAASGGNQTTARSVEAVGRGVASIIKTVGANRIAIGGGRASVTKTVGATREAVTRSVADVGAHEILNQLLSAVSVNIASMATSSQFRLTLESVAVAIASISSRTTRAQTLQAVTGAIAEFSSHTTRLGNFVAFARNIAETIKTVGKNIEAQGRAIAADQVGYFVRQEAVATAVAFLADATRVTASGSAVVVTANPYVLSLGDSVKRFKSLLQHGAGLGRGTTSDRDPDS